MMKISLIPNDFSHDLEKVFQLCAEENVKYVELASMWGKSILDLTEEELSRVHSLMDKYNLQAASIQTQIMKVHPPGSPGAKNNGKMHDDYNYNISQIDKAIKLAKEFNADYIISYSFMGKKSHDAAAQEIHWQKMFETYENFIPKLKAAGKTMCIECDGGQYLGSIDDHLKLFEHLDSTHVQANFDMANLYHVQEFTRADFDRFHKWVPYFHIKDRKIWTGFWKKLFGISAPAVTGTGSIPWRTVLPWFAEKNFDGFLSIEPHVHRKHFERGRKCVQNLQKMLTELNLEFE